MEDNVKSRMNAMNNSQKTSNKKREQFTIEEKSRMFVEMIAERKRFFAAQIAEKIINKPPTRAQLRNKMRQKIEDDAEKEDLRACLDILPGMASMDANNRHQQLASQRSCAGPVEERQASSRMMDSLVCNVELLLKNANSIEFVKQTGVAAVVPLYVFPAVPYKCGERCVCDISVMTDYAALGAPPDAEEVRDCEKTPTGRTGLLNDRPKHPKLHHSVRDVLANSRDTMTAQALCADNRPPMLEKDMYDSWKCRMELYMMNRRHGRMILESVENGPLIWPSIEENGVTRPKKYSELFATEAIQADCDIKATNIILQGLPLKVYALVSNHKVNKELWERIQLLMQGTSLMKQERECKLYDEFDKFVV
ncbi:retrovirus-related pol polyprotein from transposon TNT 1-94 [Tanacetum coccineum]